MNSTDTKTFVLVFGTFMTTDASVRAADQRLGLFFAISDGSSPHIVKYYSHRIFVSQALISAYKNRFWGHWVTCEIEKLYFKPFFLDYRSIGIFSQK